MRNRIVAFLTVIMVVAGGSAAFADEYTSSGTGHGGEVPVTVVYEDGEIKAIEVGDNSETDGIGTIAIEQLPGVIVAQQSLDVDTVTGATETSTAILTAVEGALADNGIDTAAFHNKENADGNAELVQGESEGTDVVIVGAGLSGLMAAYELKNNYPDVDYIIIEKLGMVGGSIPGTGGAMAAVGSEYHERDGVLSKPEDFIDLFEFTSDEKVNENLVMNVYEESDVLLDWLLDERFPFEEATGQTSKYNDAVYYLQTELKEGAKVRGAAFGEYLSEYVEKNPINLRMNTKATSLIVEDGKVAGVSVEDKEKKYNILASAVLLSTGGFGSSIEMMEEYLPVGLSGHSIVPNVSVRKEKKDIPVYMDYPKSVIYDVVIRDQNYWVIRGLLQNGPQTVQSIADTLECTTDKVEDFVTVATYAVKNNAKLLDARYHTFIRATDSAFITLGASKKLSLTRAKELFEDGKDYAVFECGICTFCHAIYLLGQITYNGYFIQKSTNDGDYYQDILYLGEEISDDDEDHSLKKESIQIEKKKLCARCGKLMSEPLSVGEKCEHSAEELLSYVSRT